MTVSGQTVSDTTHEKNGTNDKRVWSGHTKQRKNHESVFHSESSPFWLRKIHIYNLRKKQQFHKLISSSMYSTSDI